MASRSAKAASASDRPAAQTKAALKEKASLKERGKREAAAKAADKAALKVALKAKAKAKMQAKAQTKAKAKSRQVSAAPAQSGADEERSPKAKRDIERASVDDSAPQAAPSTPVRKTAAGDGSPCRSPKPLATSFIMA